MIQYVKGKIERLELYDLLADIDEKVNLAGNDSYSVILHNLLNEIEIWKESVINSVNTVGCLEGQDISEEYYDYSI